MSKSRQWRQRMFCLSVVVAVMVLASCGRQTETEPVPAESSGQETESQRSTETVQPKTREVEKAMTEFDFSEFENVNITDVDVDALSAEQKEVLYCRARYCEAMTEIDTDTMRELMAEDLMLTHMSGKQQTREEYLADVASEELRYYQIGIESPVIEVSGNQAILTSTSALTANAYGAKGTFRMEGTSHYEKRDGKWIMINEPK